MSLDTHSTNKTDTHDSIGVQLQDALAVKAEAARKQAIKQKQQDFMAQCDGQMEELRFKRLEEARHKKVRSETILASLWSILDARLLHCEEC